MDCSPPGSSVQGILWARILGWLTIPFSRGISQPRGWTWVSWATREAQTPAVRENFRQGDTDAAMDSYVHTQYASRFGKLSSGHRTGKGRFSFQSQRKAMPKNVQTTAQLQLVLHPSKAMLKILQARLQPYMNWELTAVQAGFRKGRGTRNQIVNIYQIIEKAREFQKTICFIDHIKAFDYVDQNDLWKILEEMGIPDQLTHLLGNLYAGQEATVRTRQNNGLVPNWERSTSRLYIVTWLI